MATSEETPLTITGRVTANDDPLAGAEVVLAPGSLTTVTDADGRFAFQVDGTGEAFPGFTLEVRREGYAPEVLGVIVGRSGIAVVDVSLQPLPEPEPEPGPEPFQGVDLYSFTPLDEVFCLAPGVVVDYTVTIANEGSAPSPAIVLHDTLDTGFGRALTSDDIAVDRARFPDAVVTLDPGGRSFHVELGPLPPLSPPVEVFTVALPVGPQGPGVYCNRVTAASLEGTALADAASCVTNTLAIRIDLINEDGSISEGRFTAEPEVFHVGDGGSSRPEALVFRVGVAIGHCFPVEDLTLTDVLGARAGGLEFRDVLPGYPTRGAVVTSGTDGFVWEIGTLGGREEAEIRFRAEAVQAGEDVNRILVEARTPITGLVNEEPVTILP